MAVHVVRPDVRWGVALALGIAVALATLATARFDVPAFEAEDARVVDVGEVERGETRVHAWTATLALPSRASAFEVAPEVLVRVDGGSAQWIVRSRAWVNDHRVAEDELRAFAGGFERWLGGPGAVAGSPPPLREGANVVRVEVEATLVGTFGTPSPLTLGPLVVGTVPRDADGDGVADAIQVLPHVPTPLLALALGLLVTLTAASALGARPRWPTAPPPLP